jgi:hypothetical protein
MVIEESRPFYLADLDLHKKIKSYIKKNFILDKIQYNEKKIFLRSQETVYIIFLIHLFLMNMLKI